MKEHEKPEPEVEQGVEEYENAVEHTGFGRFNILLLFLSGGSIMTLLVETMAMAYVVPAAQCDLNLTISDKSLISSISFLGIVFSSLLWGFLADAYGRRKVTIYAISISCFFGFLSSIAPYVWLFIICRFLNGFFIGCPASVTVAYIGEFHAAKYRGKVISWTGAFVAVASLYLPGLSWLILPMEWSFYIPGLDIVMRPWRLLIIMFSLPSFLIALAHLWFPESPKFLWSVGKSEEALTVLRNIYSINTGKDKALFPVTRFEANKQPEKIVTISSGDASPKSMWQLSHKLIQSLWGQMKPLFTYPLLKNTLLTSFLQFGIQAGAQGVFMWVPEIFNRMTFYMEKFPNNDGMTLCKSFEYQNLSVSMNYTEFLEMEEPGCIDVVNEGVFIITLIFGAVYTLAFVLLGFVIDIFGKKLLLVIILCITGTGGALVNSMQTMEAIIVCLGMYLMTGPCMNLVFSVQVDLFPTQHRAKAVAISQVFGRIGAVLGSSIVGFLLGLYCPSVFYIFSGVHGSLIILSLMLPIPLFIKRTKT